MFESVNIRAGALTDGRRLEYHLRAFGSDELKCGARGSEIYWCAYLMSLMKDDRFTLDLG